MLHAESFYHLDNPPSPLETFIRMSKEKQLTPLQMKFIAEFLRGSRNATEAARNIGLKDPNNTGPRMLHHPVVAAEIAKATREVIESGKHDLKQILENLDDDMDLARKSKQYTAVAKMHELKMKSLGHLTEKIDLRTQGYSLNIIGLAPLADPVVGAVIADVLKKSSEEEEDPFDPE